MFDRCWANSTSSVNWAFPVGLDHAKKVGKGIPANGVASSATEAITKSQKLNKRDMEAAKFLAKHSLGVDNNSLERVISALEAALDAKNETIAVMAMRFAQPVNWLYKQIK